MRPILPRIFCLTLALSALLSACVRSGDGPKVEPTVEDSSTGATTVIDVSAYHLRFSLPSPWQVDGSPSRTPEANGTVAYWILDPARMTYMGEEGFGLVVYAPGQSLLVDLAPEARDAALAAISQRLMAIGGQEVELAHTRSIGGSTGLEVRVRGVGHTEHEAWVRFPDGVALSLGGGAYFTSVPADEQETVFGAILDSIERY